jgi:hypothetical protein
MQITPSRKFASIIFTVLSVASTNALADLLSECNQVVNSINKSAPQVLDKVTTLMNAVCVKEGNTVTLIYRNKLDVPSGAVDQARINTLKPNMVNAWCTDPTQRGMLNALNIQYLYSDATGKFVGKIDIAARECR